MRKIVKVDICIRGGPWGCAELVIGIASGDCMGA